MEWKTGSPIDLAPMSKNLDLDELFKPTILRSKNFKLPQEWDKHLPYHQNRFILYLQNIPTGRQSEAHRDVKAAAHIGERFILTNGLTGKCIAIFQKSQKS